VVGHKDSIGNERADILAKEAADYRSSLPSLPLPPTPNKHLSNPEIIPHTFDYLNKIGRFKHIYRNIAPKMER